MRSQYRPQKKNKNKKNLIFFRPCRQTDGAHLVTLSDLAAGTRYSLRGVATNGGVFSTPSADQLVVVTAGLGPDTREDLLPLWLIILIIVVALLLLILLILCCIRRNRGGKYAVQKKEREAGYNNMGGGGGGESGANGVEVPLSNGVQDGAFHRLKDEEEEEEEEKFGGSQTSISSTARRKKEEAQQLQEEEEEEMGEDDDSLIVYNLDPGVDVSKFNEDGSFIGQYGRNRGGT